MTAIALPPARSLFAELHRRQPILARAGWLMLGIVGACFVAMLFDPRMLNGVSVWVKPQKFAMAFVPLFWTMAWAWGVLAPETRNGAVARIALWGTLSTAGAEQVWMTLRAGLGLPSHFVEGGWTGIAYLAMGVTALLLTGFIALVGVLVLCRPDAAQPRPWRLAVGLGLVISGVLGGFTGYSMSAHGASRIGGLLSDARNLPPFFWSRTGGDLRIAHFLGIHAMQAVPLLALLGAGLRTVWLGAIGWAALTLAAYRAAFAGIALMP